MNKTFGSPNLCHKTNQYKKAPDAPSQSKWKTSNKRKGTIRSTFPQSSNYNYFSHPTTTPSVPSWSSTTLFFSSHPSLYVYDWHQVHQLHQAHQAHLRQAHRSAEVQGISRLSAPSAIISSAVMVYVWLITFTALFSPDASAAKWPISWKLQG